MNFAGRTAVVTGATRGIGRAIADLLEAAGAQVLRTGTREAGTQAAGDGTSGPGGGVYAQLDLADEASLERFAAEVEALQALDVLVNNAGINIVEPIGTMDPAHFDRVLAVNLNGAIRVTTAAARAMRQTGRGGHILNVSSIYGVISRAGRGAYSASKTGLIAFTRAVALDLAPDRVLVNALCPGFTRTELTESILSAAEMAALASDVPLGRFAEPDEMARTAAFLVSDENTFMTGQTVVADGGYTIR